MADNPKTGFSFQWWNGEHLRLSEKYARLVDKLYDQAIQDSALLVIRLNPDPDRMFTFHRYPGTKKQFQQILRKLTNDIKDVIQTGSAEQWLFANKKQDAFLKSILKTAAIDKDILAGYQDRNLDALKAFQNRKVKGLTLSRRIWKYTNQFKNHIELSLDLGLGEGKSVQKLSQDVRKDLLEPDRLFRRVRDKYGNLQLSKAAKAYHPGRGVYRSSYKNAMRLARSEVNMAYRSADNLRWQQLDFVTGFEVKLSNNHTLNGVPFVDICDELVGKYPTWFKFVGWHPQCRCFKVPILKDPDEFDADELGELKSAFNGSEYNKLASRKEVKGLPGNFKKWAVDNQKKIDGYKSTPYFIKDNFKYGKIRNGVKK